jgi:hypothetical protein
LILGELDRLKLEPRAIGRSDYPTDLPLREVLVLARHCSAGVILGFEQPRVESASGNQDALAAVFLKWQARVRSIYYMD